jgi:hopanoid biosynthesis associated RND transporter like protein HpnN
VLVRTACRRPVVTVVACLVAAALGLAVTVSGLGFRTSTRDLLPADAPYSARYAQYTRDFGELEDIVVVVEARTFEAARAFAVQLVNALRESPIAFKRIAYRIDPKQFEGRELLYLPVPELQAIRDRIFDHQAFMQQFAGEPTLATLIRGVNSQLAAAFAASFFDLGLDEGSPRADTRFLSILLDQMSARLERPTPYRSPWGTLLSLGDEADADAGYFLSDDKSLLFILVETPEGKKGTFRGDQEAIEGIRSAIDRLRRQFPTVQAGVTGAPALSNDEMAAALGDSQVADVLAFGLTLLVMFIVFRRVIKPLALVGVLIVSICWSLGVTTLTVGHLTIFSVMFVSIVVGIGIDYGIYVLFRYEEEVFLGRSLREALEITAARAGPGILLGALTAAGTFYVLVFTEFRGIQELGFIAGTAILLAWLAMMTLLPAILVLMDRRQAAEPRGQEPRAYQLQRIRVPWLEWVTAYPKPIVVVAGLATALSLHALLSVSFDYNLLNLQAKGTESVIWERRILENSARSGFNALASADSYEELRRKQEAFEALPSVSTVESAVRLIPDRQPEKIRLIESFAPLVAPVRLGRFTPVDVPRLRQALRELNRRFDIIATEAGDSAPADIRAIPPKIEQLIRRLDRTPRDTAESALTHLQAQLYRDFVAKFHQLQRNLAPSEVGPDDVPDELRRKFISPEGRFLLVIHPRVDIWSREGATAFVDQLRSVDREVTGSPIITYEAIRHMERGYQQGTVWAVLVVAALTFAMLRRVRHTLLALLPMPLALLWTIGLMQLFGLKFNLANVWALPLLIGTATEFGLSVAMRYLEDTERGAPFLARSTVLAVFLNGLTTFVGFGSLMISRHQGIFDLGLLLTIGSAAGLLSSLVAYPAIVELLPLRAEERSGVAPQHG